MWEWNEAIPIASSRGQRGGSWADAAGTNLAACFRFTGAGPGGQFGNVGFRVAALPEPGLGLLLSTGLVGLVLQRNRQRA